MPSTVRVVERPDDTMTMSDIVAAYNAAQLLLGRDDQVKKFKNMKTAVERLDRAQQDLLAMHGYVALEETTDDETGVSTYVWITEKPTPPASERKEGNASTGPRVGTTNLDLDQVLTILSPANPKRPGSRAHDVYRIYALAASAAERNEVPFTGEYYTNYMFGYGHSRKLALSTLHWDIDHGYVALGPVPSEVTEEMQS
jgi:hypothetical protein